MHYSCTFLQLQSFLYHVNIQFHTKSACSLHTTSLFSENTPSCKLSRAIHLKGSLTLPPDLSCLKYPKLYMSSASPKSATLITELLSILSEWRVLSKLQSPLQARLQFVKEHFKVYIHAVSCCQVSVHKVLWCQIFHPLGHLPAHTEEELLHCSNLRWEWVWVIGVSLTKPHTCGTALQKCVWNVLCLLALI